jgi:hypothetical protein
MFGVISWLPNDGGFILTEEQKEEKREQNLPLRKKRREIHLRQLEWIMDNLPKDAIKLGIYQNWNDEDFDNDLQGSMTIRRYSEGIGMSRARNAVLKEFYESTHDWLMLCDDDAWLYDHYDPKSFINELHTSNKFDNLGAIITLQPSMSPFKKQNYNDLNRDNYVFTKGQLNLGAQVLFIRNVTKSSLNPIYFNVEFFDRVRYAEDTLFLHDWVTAGYTLHTLNTLILKMESPNDSSILGIKSAGELRKKFQDESKAELARCTNFEVFEKGGRLVLSSKKVFNITPSPVIVKRAVPLTFKENEIPKDKNPIKRKLFGRQ